MYFKVRQVGYNVLIYIEMLNIKYFVKVVIEYSHTSHASDNNEACQINISYIHLISIILL